MKQPLLSALLSLLLLLNLGGPARAATPPTGRPLAEALNPDGTLKTGLNGSFDARAFRMQTAPDGRPVFRPAGVAGAGDERWADGFGLPNGASDPVRTVVRAGSNIYIGGSFTAVGNVAANYVAKWNGTVWSSLGTGVANGMNNRVDALAVAANGDLYAAGGFTRAGGVAANYVAKWNGTAWSSLGTGTANGLNGTVAALAVAGNGEVYAGGDFQQAGGISANNVARWSGASWNSLGTGAANGVNDVVNAVAVAGNGDVYVGGNFTQAGGVVGTVVASRVAKWNGAAWSSLGTGAANGVAVTVYALALATNGDLYVGGYIGQAGGNGASNVARWNGTAWNSLGTSTSTSSGPNGIVYALAVAGNGDVYAGGGFLEAGGVAANCVAKWNGTAWSSLGPGVGSWLDSPVTALAVAGNGDVYVGGDFTQAGGATANRIARWDGTGWNNLGPGIGNGLNSNVNAVAAAGNGDIYVAGSFTQAGGVAANYVARWNGTAWSSLGTGTANGLNGTVAALAVAGNGDVYVAGNFTRAGGAAANRVAKWNGTGWSPLGLGFAYGGVNSPVTALAVSGTGDLYAGGEFQQAGGVVANYVARWNGAAWSSLGTGAANGLNGKVASLAVSGTGDLYAGGEFQQAGGVVANYVARWNGTAWSSLGTGIVNGVNNSVYALVVAGNGDLYVGGGFARAGGMVANYVARWNGTAWSSLGTVPFGLNGAVNTLVVAGNGDVYAGGYLTRPGGANYVARWDGTYWNSLGTGLNNIVIGLAIGPTGKLYVGGTFSATSDYSKVMAHFGIYDPNAPLATKATTATPAAQLFPNPAHGTATLRLPAGAPRQPLTLTDALGRTVRHYPAAAEAELDLRGLPAGTYVVRCGSISQRLVVE